MARAMLVSSGHGQRKLSTTDPDAPIDFAPTRRETASQRQTIAVL